MTKNISNRLEHSLLQVPDGQIAFDDTGGPGRLLIAAPGMGETRAMYRFLTPLLVEAGYRVVSFDLRGFGQSTARWTDVSQRAVGRDIAALITRAGAGPAVVLGHSYSGGAAAWAAVDSPSLVAGIVFLGAFVRDVPMPFYMMPLLNVALRSPWAVPFWIKYWNSLFPARKPAGHLDYQAALGANLREPGRMATVLAMCSQSRSETATILNSIRQPSLAIVGTRDADFPDPVAEASLIAGQTGGHSFMVEGAGHYPQTEFPELVAPRILMFLAGIAS